jgi:hypothetical protein
VDLMLTIRGGTDRNEIINEVKASLKDRDVDTAVLNSQSFKDIFKESGKKIPGEIISSLVPIPFLKGTAKEIIDEIAKAMIAHVQK